MKRIRQFKGTVKAATLVAKKLCSVCARAFDYEEHGIIEENGLME